jgi:predicted DNA-binding transcriptional regulator AlpA
MKEIGIKDGQPANSRPASHTGVRLGSDRQLRNSKDGDATNVFKPPKRFVTYKQLLEMGINISREQLWRLEAAGKWPRRIYLSRYKVVWDLDEVLAHLEKLAAERASRVYRTHD